MNPDLDRLLEQTVAIQRIPAPTFKEAERAEYMYNTFKVTDAAVVEMDAAGNVYARLGPEGVKPLIVSAHLDTVFSAESVTPAQRRGGRLHGPGIGDNAVALAALIELAQTLPTEQWQHPIWLVANVGEEGLGNLVGMQHIVERFGDRARAYLVLEGMALGFIYHQGLPVRRFRLWVESEGGHAWIHAGRPSAIHTLMSLGHNLLQIKQPRQRPFSLNIGRIAGGHSVNSIANHASLEIDLRASNERDLERWINQMNALIKLTRRENIRIGLEAIGHRPGGSLRRDHFLVKAAVEALRAAGISSIKLDMGSTDASLPLSLGLPSICVGLTHGGGAHSMNEFIEIEPLTQGYQALTDLITRLMKRDEVQEDSS